MTTPRALTLAAAVALVATMAGCDAIGGGDEPEKKVAEEYAVLEGDPGSVLDPQTVYVPDGRFEIGVSQSRASLDFLVVDSDGIEDLQAPEGFEFVGVTWEGGGSSWNTEVNEIMTGYALTGFDEREREPASLTVQVTPSGEDDVAQEIDLEADELGQIGDDGAVWVVVPEGARLAATVTYDGASQTVPLAVTGAGEVQAGSAARLTELAEEYASSDYGSTEDQCPFVPFADEGLDLDFYCSVSQVWSVPYVTGLGWAPEGKTWLVADVFAPAGDPTFVRGSTYVRYRAAIADWRATVDGLAPQSRLETEYAPKGEGNQRLVWQVSAPPAGQPEGEHRLRVEVDLELTKKGRSPVGPATLTATGTGVVRISATPDED